MAPYLPQDGTGGGSPYSEGGALYALGLIHANHGEGIKQFLRDSLRSTTVEVLINIDNSPVKEKTIAISNVLFMARSFNMVHV